MGEACIVELADGAVYMNNRNHDPRSLGCRSWCISRDGGESFTEFGVDQTLIEGRCHAALTLPRLGVSLQSCLARGPS